MTYPVRRGGLKKDDIYLKIFNVKTPLVKKLPRQPGKRESRYAHPSSGEVSTVEESASVAAQDHTDTQNHDDRIELLDMQMVDMADEINQLKQLVEQLTS